MLRFTIRDLLWLTVVVAILAAFFAAQNRLARRAVEAEQRAANAAKAAEDAIEAKAAGQVE